MSAVTKPQQAESAAVDRSHSHGARPGIPSTSTMMYGHTELPEHWVRHLLLLRDIQKEPAASPNSFPWDLSIRKPSSSRAAAPARDIRSTRI